MRSGNLDKRITIHAHATGQDANGEPATGWTTFATVWAGIRDLSGREFLAASGTQNAANTKITMRYLSGVTPAMRVTHGSNTYNIESVLGQDKRSLLLMCSRAE